MWHANYHFNINNGGICKYKTQFNLKLPKTIFLMIIFLYRTAIPFIWYAKYNSTANNGNNDQEHNFSKIWYKLFEEVYYEDMASFSGREYPAFASDMHIIIILSRIV